MIVQVYQYMCIPYISLSSICLSLYAITVAEDGTGTGTGTGTRTGTRAGIQDYVWYDAIY